MAALAVGGLVVGAALAPSIAKEATRASAEAAVAAPEMVWLSRVLLILVLCWLVIGMLSARTRLVRRPGAAAARATWIAATRPWRARESTLGLLRWDRVLLTVVPGGLLASVPLASTSARTWFYVALVLASWCAFFLLVRLLARDRSPWPIVATAGGVIILWSVPSLAVRSFAAPGAQWPALWSSPVYATVFVALLVVTIGWLLAAVGWSLVARSSPPAPRP